MLNPTFVTLCTSLPPEGAQATLGAARREAGQMTPTFVTLCTSLPPVGAQATLGAARREA
jgi:hypothetical protein